MLALTALVVVWAIADLTTGNLIMAQMKFYSWNVNGLRAIEKKGFLDWLKQASGDIVAVQETKAHPAQLSAALLNPSDYHAAWSSAEKKGYSGVGTYSRQLPVAARTGFDDERFDKDGRILISDFERFVFFNIYFPNGGRGPEWVKHKLEFYTRFLAVVAAYTKRGRSVVITGDVNTAYAEIDLARPKENVKKSGFLPEEREALQAFFAAGLIDTYRLKHPTEVKYTWWDMVTRARERNVGWRIDYFFVTPDLAKRVVDADIHPEVMGSDHCPISLTLDV
jgi:exodeoxyribonuclease-3